MDKEQYEVLEMEIIAFEEDDVITTSFPESGEIGQ